MSKPDSAPDVTGADDARDDATAAAVLNDEEKQPGGGGMGGAEAGQAPRGMGGASPNAPVDTGVAGGDPEGEARGQALDDLPEDHPSSQ